MKGWEQHIFVTRLSRAEQLLWDVQQVSSSRGPEEQEGRTVTCNGMSGSRDCESCWLATNVRNRCASFHATLSSHRVPSNEGNLDTSSLTSSDLYYSLHSCILVTRCILGLAGDLLNSISLLMKFVHERNFVDHSIDRNFYLFRSYDCWKALYFHICYEKYVKIKTDVKCIGQTRTY